jgi:hypothetical protein
MPPIQYETDPTVLAGRTGNNDTFIGKGVLNAAVGAGKPVNDLAVGMQQAFYKLYDGDEAKAKEAGEKLARDEETYNAWSEKQVGMEDLGEVVGNLGLWATGGKGLNATWKGSTMLGAFIEGLKGTESGSFSESLEQGGWGAAGGLGGHALGSLLTKWTPKLEPETEKIIVEQGKKLWGGSGMRDLSTGILGKITGVLDKSTAARAIFNGVKHIRDEIKITDVGRRFLIGADKSQLDMETKRLAAKRAEQIGAAQRAAFGKMAKLMDSMGPSGRDAVIAQDTGQTFKELVNKSKLVTDNGDVGINMGEFLKASPLFNKEFERVLGPTSAKQLKAIGNLWGRQTKKVLSLSEIYSQLQAFATINTEKTMEILGMTGKMTPKQIEAQSTLLDYIIKTGSASAGAAAGN